MVFWETSELSSSLQIRAVHLHRRSACSKLTQKTCNYEPYCCISSLNLGISLILHWFVLPIVRQLRYFQKRVHSVQWHLFFQITLSHKLTAVPGEKNWNILKATLPSNNILLYARTIMQSLRPDMCTVIFMPAYAFNTAEDKPNQIREFWSTAISMNKGPLFNCHLSAGNLRYRSLLGNRCKLWCARGRQGCYKIYQLDHYGATGVIRTWQQKAYDIFVLHFHLQGGLSTRDEMCLSFLFYYPRVSYSYCDTRLFSPSIELLKKYL